MVISHVSVRPGMILQVRVTRPLNSRNDRPVDSPPGHCARPTLEELSHHHLLPCLQVHLHHLISREKKSHISKVCRQKATKKKSSQMNLYNLHIWCYLERVACCLTVLRFHRIFQREFVAGKVLTVEASHT